MPRGLTDYYKNRIILVTGASGFVGRHLCSALHALGAQVIAMVRRPLNLPYKTYLAKLEDFYAIEGIIAESQPEGVFHLGAQTQVTVAQKAPLHTFEANIRGTYHILEACRRHNVSKVLIASSDKAYGPSKKLPYEEEDPLKGSFPYDVSKSCADLLAQSYFQSYQLPLVITRCANLYGPGDHHHNRLIPAAIAAFFQGKVLSLRSNGRSSRDYLFIRDAIEGLLRAHAFGREGEAYNFGTGISYSALEVVKKIGHLLGKEIFSIIKENSLCEIDNQVTSFKKAERDLNWKPQISFNEGLAQTIAWAESQNFIQLIN